MPNPVLTYKSYVSKYLINADSKDQNNYLDISTRCITLDHIILGKHESHRQAMNAGFYVLTHKSSISLKVSECKMYVKHTKWPSALAYDEIKIHVKRWVIMKSKCSKVNECGDIMIRG